MPYELHGNCVHKRGDDKPLKCYDNRADALAYLRALEANVEEAKQMMLLTQAEANYTPVSTARGKACSGCRFFCGDHCHIVMGEIAPNGYCDRYEAPPAAEEPAPTPVTIVEPEYAEMSTDEQGIFDRIWGRIQKALNRPTAEGVFSVQKDLKGNWRWVATYTNKFIDREGEIISDKALDGYLSRLEMKLVPMPELWAAHLPETKHGQADMVFGVGSFVVATGTFDETPIAQKAIEYYRKNAAKVALSHGFTYPKWALKGGVYEEINTFEITTLPPPLVASNPYTDLEVMSMKQITPDTEAALAQLFGKEETEKLIASRRDQSKALEEAGVAYKDFVDVNGAGTAAATLTEDAQPDPVATLLQSLIADMASLVQNQIDNGKAFAAYRTQQDAKVKELTDANVVLKTALDTVQAELKLTPRRASESAATAIDEKLAKELIGQPTSETDSFWK